jgi:hypothetical protein
MDRRGTHIQMQVICKELHFLLGIWSPGWRPSDQSTVRHLKQDLAVIEHAMAYELREETRHAN